MSDYIDLSSTLKTVAMCQKFHKTSRNVIQGRLSTHQLLATLNATDKDVTHSLNLPCLNIEGNEPEDVYGFGITLYLSFKSSEPYTNYIALGLTNKNEVGVKLRFKVSIEKSDSSLEHFGNYTCFLEEGQERKSYFLKESLMKSPNKYLPEGNMVIVCDVTMDALDTSSIVETSATSLAMAKEFALRFAPAQNFDPVFGYSDELSDFTIFVEEKKLGCHKAIVGSRSEVFRRMFTSNMSEKQSNSVNIYDVDAENVSNLLIFMYTDRVDANKITIELLAAANKYEVPRLKEICDAELSQRLEMENVCEYWYEAHLHGTQNLLRSSFEFMARNWNEVRGTPEFQQLEVKFPEIVKNIASMLANAFKL